MRRYKEQVLNHLFNKLLWWSRLFLGLQIICSSLIGQQSSGDLQPYYILCILNFKEDGHFETEVK